MTDTVTSALDNLASEDRTFPPTPEFAAQVKALPGLDVMAANSANAKHARPTVAGYNAMSEAIGDQISAVLQGQGDPEGALKAAATKADEALAGNGP